MTTLQILNLLERMDQLIRLRATGTPTQFAQKIELSKSMLYMYLELLKDLGAPIQYSKSEKTYFYAYKVTLYLKYKKNEH